MNLKHAYARITIDDVWEPAEMLSWTIKTSCERDPCWFSSLFDLRGSGCAIKSQSRRARCTTLRIRRENKSLDTAFSMSG